MRVAAIIQARMSSTRLPGKVVMPIVGKTTLELMVERVRRTCVDDIIIATTKNPIDDIITYDARKMRVRCFRGSEDDVLSRVLGAAKLFSVDVIVELTADCPLIDPDVIKRVISVYQSGEYDYVSNVLKRTYPRGMDTQIFSTDVLNRVAGLTSDPVDHEHVSLFIYEHPEMFELFNVESGLPEKYWELRLTLDTIEDFRVIETIYKNLYTNNPNFTLHDVLCFIDSHPEVMDINRDIKQKVPR